MKRREIPELLSDLLKLLGTSAGAELIPLLRRQQELTDAGAELLLSGKFGRIQKIPVFFTFSLKLPV